MRKFYVIYDDVNKKEFVPYDIMGYLVDQYKRAVVKPKTIQDFIYFVEKRSMYMFWSRCEYEIVIHPWASKTAPEKWDIHRQIMMNIYTIAEILMDNVKKRKPNKKVTKKQS